MSFFLAIKEILRNKLRFLAVTIIVALIALLILFSAGLGDGLALGSKQYIENIEADLIIFQENVELSIPVSRLNQSKLNNITRLPGVAAASPIGFAAAAIVPDHDQPDNKLEVSLIGVEPDKPGNPTVFAGQSFRNRRANEVILDQNVLDQIQIPIGSTIDLKVVQGTEEKIHSLRVAGYTEGQKYGYQPSVFVPLLTWNRIKPQTNLETNNADVNFNIVAIKLKNPQEYPEMVRMIEQNVKGIEVTDLVTTYQATPGYTAQQNTFSMLQGFTLFIALLVVSGFFQIQTLQKVGQIGMLKAIGGSSRLIAFTVLVQSTITTLLGLLIGGATVWLLAVNLPPDIPVVFNGQKAATAVTLLMVIGPVAGLVSIRTLLKVEPLTALGLGD